MLLRDEPDEPMTCQECGKVMRSDIAQMPMWLGNELKLIDRVPVQVCDNCDRQQYAPRVEAAIRRLVGAGFPDRKARRQVLVPVFDLDDFAEPAEAPRMKVAAE